MKKGTFLFIIFISILGFIYYSFTNQQSTTKLDIKDIPGVTGPGSNTLSYGLYNTEGKIHSEEFISFEDGNLSKIFSMANYLDFDLNFRLIIFADFKQTSFFANNQEVLGYDFNVKSNKEIEIPIDINIPKNSKDLSFLIIRDPHLMLNLESIEEALELQHIISLRFKNENIPYEFITKQQTLKVYEESSEGPYEPIFFSKVPEQLELFLEGKSNDFGYLNLANEQNEDVNYHVIAMVDWETIQIENNLINVFQLKPNTREIYKIKLPNLDKEKSSIQFIAFPTINSTNTEYSIEQTVFSSTRTTIKKE